MPQITHPFESNAIKLQPEPDDIPEQTEPSLLDLINWQVDNRLRELGILPQVEDED